MSTHRFKYIILLFIQLLFVKEVAAQMIDINESIKSAADYLTRGEITQDRDELLDQVTEWKEKYFTLGGEFKNERLIHEKEIAGLNYQIDKHRRKQDSLIGIILYKEDLISMLGDEMDALRENLNNCKDELSNARIEIVELKQELVMFKYKLEKSARTNDSLQDALEKTKKELMESRSECMNSSFKLLGYYKRGRNKMWINLKEKNDFNPKRLDIIRVEFETCDLNFSGIFGISLIDNNSKQPVNEGVDAKPTSFAKSRFGYDFKNTNRRKWLKRGKKYRVEITPTTSGNSDADKELYLMFMTKSKFSL